MTTLNDTQISIIEHAANRNPMTAFTDMMDEACQELERDGYLTGESERQYKATPKGLEMIDRIPDTLVVEGTAADELISAMKALPPINQRWGITAPQTATASRIAPKPTLPDTRPPVALSERQRAILAFIKRYLQTEGRPPNVREIGEAAGIKSTAAVNYQLNKLEALGYLARNPHIARGLRLVKQEGAAAHGPLVITDEMLAIYQHYMVALDEAERLDSIVYPREMEHFQADMWQATLKAIDPQRWGE
jgi:Mn-dependent DtxR family transcriptional regulator